jgi:ADP-ribose pyrophosphatase
MSRPKRLDKPLAASLGWRLDRTRYLYESDWFDLRQDELELPGGRRIAFTYVEHPGFVSIVPMTPEGLIILIRSYRYTIDDWSWEIPAGGLGNKPGMSPREVALAELEEETGYRVEGELERVADYNNAVGNTRTPATIYFATEVRSRGRQVLDPTEVIEVAPRPAREVLEMARSGAIADGASALAILLCADRIERELSMLRSGESDDSPNSTSAT